jgi:glycosyltransferase involved in cell wall biosynthesis
LKSLIGSLEGYLSAYLNTYSSRIQRFVSPSRFLRDKVAQHGVAADKVVHIPNFVDPQQFKPNFNGSDYFVYFGRLEAFKGVRTLIRAFSEVGAAKLYIVGAGKLQAQLQQTVAAKKVQNIHFLGFKHGSELKEIVGNSLCSVCPSEWYENNPISILESFALGKPVIGAAIGGIPELVKDGITGLLFSSGDARQLAQKIEYCLRNKDQVRHMGREARSQIEENYSPEVHYARILKLYSEMTQ